MKRSFLHRLHIPFILISLTTSLHAEGPRGMVYDFGATWCGPCQQVAPLVERLQREGLPIRKVDIDKERQLANQFRIDRVPTFVLVVDGKEVERSTGAMGESDLRRMLARIPQDQPATATPNSSEGLAINLGTPGDLPRPQSQPLLQEQRDTGDKPSGISGLWPFGKKNQPTTVRGNDAELESNTESVPRPDGPMAASVRIRVVINGKVNLGSGTVISSAAGNTLILTCGHIFRDINEDAKIEVDLFNEGQSQLFIARLLKFDMASDLGLISVATESPVPTAKVAGKEKLPEIGSAVAGIGCSGGALPTHENLKVTAVDKYDGPNNIECTGLPVQGRSGGGLFDATGAVVGVCFAADRKGHRGLYSGLLAIHALLDDCGLTSLYQSSGETRVAIIDEPAENTEFNPDWAKEPKATVEAAPPERTTPPVTPVKTPEKSAVTPPTQQPVDVASGQAEVVVIIRDASQPNAPNRVVIIHDASPKFFAYLDGELQGGDRQLGQTGKLVPSAPISVSDIAQQTKPLEVLPTTLSQPMAPRRYVRKAQ